LSAVAVTLGVFLAETAILAGFLAGSILPSPALLLHSCIVLALFLWAGLTQKRSGNLVWPLMLAAVTASMGPAGAGGALLTMVLTRYFRRDAMPFDSWYASLFPEEHGIPHPLLPAGMDSVSVTEAVGVASFIDVLGFGTLNQKQELVALITRHFRPAFAPALRMALGDSANAIRVQAASAVARIEDEFMKRSFALGSSVARRKDAAELLALALHHDEYAATGLLDLDREADSRHRALEAYREYLRVQPSDLRAQAAVGRLLIQSGKVEEAAQWLDGCLEQDSSSNAMLLSYMEALFRLGRFSQLRELASRHSAEITQRAGFMDNSSEAVKLWAQPPLAACGRSHD
jgi:hypothetical protein